MHSPDIGMGSIVNVEVFRNVLLNSSLCEHTVSVTARNVGPDPVSVYCVAIPARLVQHVAFLRIYQPDYSMATRLDAGQIIEENGQSFCVYCIELFEPMEPGTSRDFSFQAIYGRIYSPYSPEITKLENQFLLYNDSYYWTTPYKTAKQKSIFVFPNYSIKLFRELRPYQIAGNRLLCGTYEDVDAFSSHPAIFYFMHNIPLIFSPKIVREVKVSHWGSVAIEDLVQIQNEAAATTGGFLDPNDMKTTNLRLSGILIETLDNLISVYYRDAIGNVSTSHFDQDGSLYINFRYSLNGGWRTSFCLGYTYLARQFLFVSATHKNLYTLRVPIGAQYGFDIFLEEQVVKVVLPRGATNVNFTLPFEMRVETFTYYSYLDFIGRTMFVFHRNHLSSIDFSEHIEITYDFSPINLLFKPLFLGGSIFLVMLIVFALFTTDISISTDDPFTQSKNKLALDDLLKKYLDAHQQRIDCLEKMNQSSTSTGKRLKNTLNETSQSISTIIHQIETLNPDKADQLKQIEQLIHTKIQSHTQKKKNDSTPTNEPHFQDPKIEHLIRSIA